MIDADDAHHKMEEHCKALEDELAEVNAEVRNLTHANYQGNQELEEVKAKVIELGKAKSAMHKRAQKAEGALEKMAEKQLKLANSLAGATELYRKAQSERDKNRNTCIRLQREVGELKTKLIEAESPRAFMQKVEAVRQAQRNGVEIQGKKSVIRGVCGTDRELGFYCNKTPNHAGPCHWDPNSPSSEFQARLNEAQLCAREERIDRLESENKQLKTALQSVPKQKERIGWAKQINRRNARIAELELVVQDLEKTNAPVAIAQAKYAAIQTAVRAGTAFGSFYALLQYLTS